MSTQDVGAEVGWHLVPDQVDMICTYLERRTDIRGLSFPVTIRKEGHSEVQDEEDPIGSVDTGMWRFPG